MLPLHFMPYQIFAHLACPCMALFLATLVLLHIRSIMFEDLCSFPSKKKNLNYKRPSTALKAQTFMEAV